MSSGHCKVREYSPLKLGVSAQAQSKTMKRILTRMLIATGIAILVTLLWYAQSRIFAKYRAVDLQELGASGTIPTNQGKLTIGTFNIAHGRGGHFGASNWTGASREQLENHLGRIADQISNAIPDIMILNEADIDSTWSKRINEPVCIAQKAHFNHLVTQRNLDIALPFSAFRFGNAVMSRFPIGDARRIVFPPYSKREHLLAGNHDGLLCRVQTPLGDIRVMAVHLEYRSEAIRVECARLITEIAGAETTPLIVAGDFNSAPTGFPKHEEAAGHNAMDLLLGSGLFDTLMPASKESTDMTFPSEKPDRVIDWILTTHDFKQANRKVHASQLSDHNMLTVEVIPTG